jgi:hypothetical protein
VQRPQIVLARPLAQIDNRYDGAAQAATRAVKQERPPDSVRTLALSTTRHFGLGEPPTN